MFATIVTDPLVLLIPFIAAFIGWFTNVLAVRMMFYPVEFFGVRPWFGWQGIVPGHATEMAGLSTELITTKLINLRILFEGFDAKEFSGNLDKAIDEITEQVIEQVASRFGSEMWADLPEEMKDEVRKVFRTEVEAVTVAILADMRDSIEEIIDLKAVVLDAIERDKPWLGEMFQTVGVEEFKFIKRSGAYFGFIFGIVQLFAWLIHPAVWVLPGFGFFVGYVTNWLAIKLIFEPAQPKRIGPWMVQGLFHKRQQEVAREFAAMVDRDILNPDNLVGKMTEGAWGEKLFGIVERRVGELLERYRENPMVKGMVPEDEWGTIRTELFARVREELPKPGGFLYFFTTRAMDVYGELSGRMSELDPESFEGVLRPAFQQDEWKLILAGAVLGFGAGVLQLLYLFKDMLI